MIALLVVYTALGGAAFAGAAWCAERAALLARWPARWSWAVALALTCALPAAAVGRAHAPAPPIGPAAVDGSTLAMMLDLLTSLGGGGNASSSDAPTATAAIVARLAASTAALDRPVGWVWGALTMFALARVTRRGLHTRRAICAASAAPATRVHAVRRARALVTPTLGPAVLGGWRATLAMPAWLWEQLDAPRRRLVFSHEAEHLRSGDPRLLTAAAVAVALVPWSPVGWWMLARLRAAVEIDCDRRVLARGARRAGDRGPVATYGSLLLDVAAYHAAVPTRERPRLAPALAEPGRSTLERRIWQMTVAPPARPHLRFALLALASVACVVGACELPRPTGIRATPATSRANLTTAANGAADTMRLSVEQVRASLGPARVAAMQRATGRAQLVYLIDAGDGSRRVVLRTPGSGPTADQLSFSDATIAVQHFAPGVIAADSTTVAWVRLGAAGESAARPAGVVTAPRIRMRGDGNTTSGTDSVLVVVDGRVVGRGPAAIGSVPRDSIVSVDVLKGTAATERFGDAGRAGVVVITLGPPRPATPR